LRLQLSPALFPQRVKIADDQIETQTEHLCETAARVGGDYEAMFPAGQPLADGVSIINEAIGQHDGTAHGFS
jgi:hypothetical protein